MPNVFRKKGYNAEILVKKSVKPLIYKLSLRDIKSKYIN